MAVRLGINIKNENRNLNAEKEVPPDKLELSKIMRMATPRERLAISLMAFSGLRPEVMGNMDGTDGIQIGDIPDLKINGKEIEFEHIPVRLVVRPELSKIRIQYSTFIGQQGVDYIRHYLQTRISNGETLK